MGGSSSALQKCVNNKKVATDAFLTTTTFYQNKLINALKVNTALLKENKALTQKIKKLKNAPILPGKATTVKTSAPLLKF